MKLPVLKKLLIDDFQDQATWIGRLFYPLNLFFNAVYSGLNHGLTIQDNMLALLKVMQVSGSATGTSFTWPFTTNPVGVLCVACVSTSGVGSSIPTFAWSYSKGTITLSSLSGLSSGTTYNLTFYVIGG